MSGKESSLNSSASTRSACLNISSVDNSYAAIQRSTPFLDCDRIHLYSAPQNIRPDFLQKMLFHLRRHLQDPPKTPHKRADARISKIIWRSFRLHGWESRFIIIQVALKALHLYLLRPVNLEFLLVSAATRTKCFCRNRKFQRHFLSVKLFMLNVVDEVWSERAEMHRASVPASNSALWIVGESHYVCRGERHPALHVFAQLRPA